MVSADEKIEPPGPQRSYPKPTKSGSIPFEYAPNSVKAETKYWLWGDLSNGKTPLIGLHGGPGVPSGYMVPLTLVHEDHGIPVLLYDQIGCGESTRFKDRRDDKKFWSVEMFMAELDNVIAHFGIKEFDLLGHSWGGMLAGQYAIEKQPKVLRKLIISDSPSSMALWGAKATAQRKTLPQDLQDTLDRCEKEGRIDSEEYEAATMEFYRLYMCRMDKWPEELSASLGALEEDNTVYYTMNGPNEFFTIGSLKDWNITEDLSKITEETCPGGMLVVHGYYDSADDVATGAFWSKPSAKTKWVTFMLSAHMPLYEEAEKYIAVLGTFLTT